MAQSSRPQAGNITTDPTYVDSGPYAADRWATLFRVLFTGDQQGAQGVLRGVWNELAPTNPSGRTIRVDTGVGVCNGHAFFNDTSAITIGVDAGVARNDTLVMLENNTNAAISAGAVTNYNTDGPDTAIPPYSCRLAVVKGVAITQTTALYMTPLATFTTGAANITNLTDTRTYCAFSTEVNTLNLADDAVDDTKVGNRVPQFYRRQGGDATDWNDSGTTTYTPGMVRMQAGVSSITISDGSYCSLMQTVTFPVAFSDAPIVLLTLQAHSGTFAGVEIVDLFNAPLAASFAYIACREATTNDATAHIHWLAIGPE